MSETKHTPGPWKAGRFNTNPAAPIQIYGPDRDPIVTTAHCYGDHDANAAFIVRACNSHDALVAALEHIVESIEDAKHVLGSDSREGRTLDAIMSCGAMIEVRAALKLARGEG
jgi:hypothetical protein